MNLASPPTAVSGEKGKQGAWYDHYCAHTLIRVGGTGGVTRVSRVAGTTNTHPPVYVPVATTKQDVFLVNRRFGKALPEGGCRPCP